MNGALLSRVAYFLYDAETSAADLAAALGNINERTMRRWLLDQQPIPPRIAGEVVSLLEEHARDLARLIADVRAIMPQPEETSND